MRVELHELKRVAKNITQMYKTELHAKCDEK